MDEELAEPGEPVEEDLPMVDPAEDEADVSLA